MSRGGRRRRFSLAPVVTFLLGVALLSGIVHIAVILLVPVVAKTDGWSRLTAVAESGRFAPVTAIQPEGQPLVPGLDPLFVHGACRIDISEAPAQLSFAATDNFWSLAIYDPSDIVVFSLNDRTAIEGFLELLVVTPLQATEIRETEPAIIARNIVVESEETDLVALVRLYAPGTADAAAAREVLAEATCEPREGAADDQALRLPPSGLRPGGAGSTGGSASPA